MTFRVKRVLARILPPIVSDALRSVARQRVDGNRLEYLPLGWPAASEGFSGWNHESVAASQLRSWPAFLKRVSSPNPVSGVSGDDGRAVAPDYAHHNTMMVFAYVVGLSNKGGDELSILDWGSGLGQYAVLVRELFPHLVVDYHSRELPILAKHGARNLPDVTFHDSDIDAFARTYDLVVASGSLQYTEVWTSSLAALAKAATRYLYVGRLPVVRVAESFVVMQHPGPGGYETDYPGWVLNRREFLDAASAVGLDLVREFLIWEPLAVANAPEVADSRAFLFAPRTG